MKIKPTLSEVVNLTSRVYLKITLNQCHNVIMKISDRFFTGSTNSVSDYRSNVLH